MDSESVDKVLDFFKDIISQLGPAGEQAYQLIYARVIAEAVVAITLGSVLLVIGIVVARKFWLRSKEEADSYYSDKSLFQLLTLMSLAISGTLFVMFVPFSIINLLSPDYATITRILQLVGTAR